MERNSAEARRRSCRARGEGAGVNEESEKRMQGFQAEVEEWKEKYRKMDEYAADMHAKVTKQWEEEFDKQLEIKLRGERGKLEAELKENGRNRAGQECITRGQPSQRGRTC